MRTHLQIIADAGGHKFLAEKLSEAGCPVSTEQARFWVRREAIPTEYWPAAADLGVTTLMELAASKDVRVKSHQTSAAA